MVILVGILPRLKLHKGGEALLCGTSTEVREGKERGRGRSATRSHRTVKYVPAPRGSPEGGGEGCRQPLDLQDGVTRPWLTGGLL